MPRLLLSFSLVVCLGSASLVWSAPKKKKKDQDEITQTLEVPKDPPTAVTAEASRLVFLVTPLSAKGLLSAQIREAIKSMLSQSHGGRVVKIRAFVAGSGDMRRVPALVSEIFSDKKLPLPAVSVIQVGALPLTGAQVVLEAVTVDRKVVNPEGLAFVSGQAGTASDVPAKLRETITRVSVKPESVRKLTCFVDSLESESALRTGLGSAYPKAAVVIAQLRRDSTGNFAECEAVAALDKAPPQSLVLVGRSQQHSDAALTAPGPLVFTGLQLAFGREPKDLTLALQRFGKSLEAEGTNWDNVAFMPEFLLTESIRDKYLTARAKFVDSTKKPPASTTLIFEGLPSLDASLGIEGVAVAGAAK